MKVNINDLTAFCVKVLKRRGFTNREAGIIFDDFLEGELLGVKSHGIMGFPGMIKKLESFKRKPIKIKKETKSYIHIDANAQLGHLAADLAVNKVIKMAKQTGIAMAGIYNMRPFLRPGSQAEKIAQKDLVGIVLINGGGPMVVPAGGIEPIIGTNPIGYSVPTLAEPITCDMAVSVRAIGEVRLSKLLGRKLPDNAYVDKKGNVTINPDYFFACLPFGGYKGFNLGLLFDILTGTFVNGEVGYQKKSISGRNEHYGKKIRAALFIALDPKVFTSLRKFKEKNSKLVKDIKKIKKKRGIREILIPGERGHDNKKRTLERGWLDIDEKIISQIMSLEI